MSEPTGRWNGPPNWPAPPSADWTPPPGWKPDPKWGKPPKGWQFYGPGGSAPIYGMPPKKSKKELRIALALGVILLIGIITAATGGSTSTSTTATDPLTTTAPADPAAAQPSTGNPDATGASAWIDKTNRDTHSVQVAVQSVQAGIKLIEQGSTDPASQAALSGLVQQSHDFLHDAELNLNGEIDDPLKSQREEAWYSASQLSDAMSKLRSYIDSSKPSDLADFQTQYQQGMQYWNEAVTKIWAAAGRPTPPTV